MTVPDLLPRTAVADYLAGIIRLLNFEVILKDLQAPGPIPPPIIKSARVGVNLNGVTHYSTEIPFHDAFKHAKPWKETSGSPLNLDAQGNLLGLAAGQTADTRMFLTMDGHYPDGEYICTYDGVATLQWGGAATGIVTGTVPGRELLMVVKDNKGITLRVLTTDATNPIRNIKLFQKPFPDTIYRREFINRWQKLGVFRFMNWQNTNNSTLGKWSDRTTTESMSQERDAGVALEHMIGLCNLTETDPWFCIPHLADYDFVKQFAQMCKDNLDPTRTIYVEHSNEVWNGNFAQARYARTKGVALGLHTDPKTAGALYHAQRTVEIGNHFRDIMGEGRVVRVLAGQAVNTWLTTRMLDYVVDGGQPVRDNVDAFGIAPYIGINETAATALKPIPVILNELKASIPGAMANVRAQIALIGNLPLFAYEGGQHIVATNDADRANQALTDKLIAVNNNPGMYDVYTDYLKAWEMNGGKLFMHFNSTREHSKWGSWGTLEHYDSDEIEPGKHRALIDYAEEA